MGTLQHAFPYVSVIVPFFRGTESLEGCLDALCEQEYPDDRYEIIIVNNGSPEDISWIRTDYPVVRVIDESHPGSYAARNRGIDVSLGEVLAFTDSDCIPSRYWISEGVRMLSRPEHPGLVGGRIQYFFQDPEKPNSVELYDSIRYMQQEFNISQSRYAATANMFTTRAVVDNVGLFDSAVKSGGDRDWGQRVANAGYLLAYAPEATVLHPARHTFKQLFRKSIRVVGGHHDWKSRSEYDPWKWKFFKTILLDLSPPVRFAYRLARDQRVSGFHSKVKVTAVFMADKLLRAWTRFRLQLGEPSRRA